MSLKGQLQQAMENTSPTNRAAQDSNAKPIPSTSRSKICQPQDRFRQLRSEKKHFIDTIKLIAYRAETALAELAREKIKRSDDARSLIRQLFRTEVDLIPDRLQQTLTVRLHPMSHPMPMMKSFAILCQELTFTEYCFSRYRSAPRLRNFRLIPFSTRSGCLMLCYATLVFWTIERSLKANPGGYRCEPALATRRR